VDGARASVAALLGAKPSEIVFTSGGTESDNLALFGAVGASQEPRKHVITTAIEHHAVLHACRHLEDIGCEVTFLPVNGLGLVDPDDVKRAVLPVLRHRVMLKPEAELEGFDADRVLTDVIAGVPVPRDAAK